jgi:putative FmdB family regulatory protein
MSQEAWEDMPLYEYECASCGVRFERLQHLDEEPVKTCPECGGRVRRLFQPVGIIFKGSGFYVTDHKRGGRPRNPASAKPSKRSKPPEGKESSESDSSTSTKSGDD